MAAFSERERLLLRAALCDVPELATEAWRNWSSQIELEVAPPAELRALTAVYANLSRIAGDLDLPRKLKGKARATFIQNNLLARESLPAIEALSKRFPLLIAKGLGMCIRFDAWSSRFMGDVDIHVSMPSLKLAVDGLRELGWTPQYGMSRDSLLYRSALRRSSWNFIKGRASIDLHWRPQPETESERIIQGMWNTSELCDCFGRTVRLQGVEYGFVTALAHGFWYGASADKMQTVIDCSSLLAKCDLTLLAPLIDAFRLHSHLATVLSALEESGAPAAATGNFAAMRAICVRGDEDDRGERTSTGMVRRTETVMLRHPKIYRMWEASGRRSRIERHLLRWFGPFSKPLQWSGLYHDDYDLSDCNVMDTIAGPGWAWPESNLTGFWADRADARLLLPLRSGESYMLALGLSDERIHTSNAEIDVFVNGHFLARMDLRRDATMSQHCFFISRTILLGPWVELSLRPNPYLDTGKIAPETLRLSRSIPIGRLRLYESRAAGSVLSHQGISKIDLRILSGVEPEASKFRRIKARIENSAYRNADGLPEGFDPVFYVLFHPDLFAIEVDPYEHFVHYGQFENRLWRQ